MNEGKIADHLYGKFRGEQLAILCCGHSFARVDLEEFRGWHVWAVNATITALPDWMLESPRTFWFANHLDQVWDVPIHRPFRRLVEKRYPEWRAIVHEHWMTRFGSRMVESYHYTGKNAEHPGPMGSVFCRALHTASRCGFSEIVVAGADMQRKAIPGVHLRHTPHYVAPFEWKATVPYRLKEQRDRIAQWARTGHLSGSISLHPTSDWPLLRGGSPFPEWRHEEQ